jgi:hypothetical protein
MIVSFGFFDAASTLYLYWLLGTFEYETGLLPNVLYSLGNIGMVIFFKFALTAIAAVLLYYIARLVPKLDEMCKLTCLGASVVGIMASLSNLSGALTGSTILVLGIRGDFIAYIMFTLFFLLGITDLIFPDSRLRLREKIDR